jgi:outer membrane protein OmpA-like peptidoglycan-associated protein
MNIPKSFWIGGGLLLLATSFLRVPTFAADAKDGGDAADQTDNNFYWQGTQLYNLGRLGEAFESFEKAIQRKQNTKEAEAYLLQIRQEIVNNAKKRSEEKSSLNYGGNLPDTALNVSYVQKGFIRVTIQSKYLFDENSASLKAGSMDVINRLTDLLQAKEGQRIEVTLINEIDNVVNVRDVDAERSLLVFALVNFKRFAQANASAS